MKNTKKKTDSQSTPTPDKDTPAPIIYQLPGPKNNYLLFLNLLLIISATIFFYQQLNQITAKISFLQSELESQKNDITTLPTPTPEELLPATKISAINCQETPDANYQLKSFKEKTGFEPYNGQNSSIIHPNMNQPQVLQVVSNDYSELETLYPLNEIKAALKTQDLSTANTFAISNTSIRIIPSPYGANCPLLKVSSDQESTYLIINPGLGKQAWYLNKSLLTAYSTDGKANGPNSPYYEKSYSIEQACSASMASTFYEKALNDYMSCEIDKSIDGDLQDIPASASVKLQSAASISQQILDMK